MIDTILNIASGVNSILWNTWTVIFIAAVFVYFTIRSRFFQVRGLRVILKHTFGSLLKKEEAGEDKTVAGWEGS